MHNSSYNAATGSKSSTCAKAQTNSERSSVLQIKLCYQGFIIFAIFELHLDREFIHKYWCRIVIWLFLYVSHDIALLCIRGSIIQSHLAAIDSADNRFSDYLKKWLQCSGDCNPHLFHIAWDIYIDDGNVCHFNHWECLWGATPDSFGQNVAIYGWFVLLVK